MTASLPRLVDAAALPAYPIGSDTRINNWFFRWETRRWLNSEVFLKADPDVGYCYLNLIFISQDQVPIGTLPDDRWLLAKLLRLDRDRFDGLCARDPSPLQHWRRCVSDQGEVRLMHPFVTATLEDQLADRDRRDAAVSRDAERQRIRRLREAMPQAGFSASEAADDELVDRLDRWLAETVKSGRRTPAVYERAYAMAVRQKWVMVSGGNALK